VPAGSKPSSRVISSLSETSNLYTRFGDDRPDTKDSPRQTETKSPPGPNLHSGSTGLFKRLSIYLSILSVHNCPAAGIVHLQQMFLSVMRTLTKTEQKTVNQKNFSRFSFVI
jgi:hypothetical protein